MGIAAIVFGVLGAGLGIGWWFEYNKRKWAAQMWEDKRSHVVALQAQLNRATLDNANLEAEILRLRRIPLTQEPERTDNTLIRARSAAQVRQITEASFGKMPEFEQTEEQVN